MYSIVSLIDGDKQIHFYSDGTFSGVGPGVKVLNYFPLLVLRIKALIRQGESLDDLWRTIGVSGSVGASQEIAEYSSNILSQSGDASGEK